MPQNKSPGFFKRTFFNPKIWMDYPAIKRMTLATWGAAKRVYTLKTPQARQQETFAEAIQRFQLSEGDLKLIANRYLLFALLFCGIGVGLIALGLYLMFKRYPADCIIAFSIASCVLAQAFKYHFLRFQIIKRKLGCTFQEWRTGQTN